MNYIKDTDFLPNVKDVSNDVYKLLYGVVNVRVETKIYDMITVMCRRYPDTPLRKAKINAWKSATIDTIEKLEAHAKEDSLIYIPYFKLVCSADSILNLFRFTINVLDEMSSLGRIPEYRKGTSKESIQLFFPLPPFKDLLREYGRKCVEDKSVKGDVVAAIEKELEKRGVIESSTLQAAETFDEIFYDRGKKPNISLPEPDDTSNKEEVVDMTIKTGFLYYALKHYFEIVDKKSYRREYVFGTLLTSATYRIANGMLEPNSERKPTNDNTFYSYAHNKFQRGEASKAAKENAQKLFKKFIG